MIRSINQLLGRKGRRRTSKPAVGPSRSLPREAARIEHLSDMASLRRLMDSYTTHTGCHAVSVDDLLSWANLHRIV